MPRSVTLRWEGDPNAHGRDPTEPDGLRLPGLHPRPHPRCSAQPARRDGPPGSAAAPSRENLCAQPGRDERWARSGRRAPLRAESVASSRIEGLPGTPQAEPGAGALRPGGRARPGARRRRQCQGDGGGHPDRLRRPRVRSLGHHRHPPGAAHGCRRRHRRAVREGQNRIGGRYDGPLDAEFVPPPPEEVMPLLHDLAAFVNRYDLPAVIQAAIVHAQFETIHPFADGNGRVGRCLIHVVLRRRALAPRFVPPVSVVLATNARAYVRA